MSIFSGAISLYIMAGVYIIAGLNHFINPRFYLKIIPAYIPCCHLTLVYVSGIFEIALGIGLLFPAIRSVAAWGIILMLIAFLPVHIYMLQSDEFRTIAPWLLWARLFLQLVLIYWAYQFV